MYGERALFIISYVAKSIATITWEDTVEGQLGLAFCFYISLIMNE